MKVLLIDTCEPTDYQIEFAKRCRQLTEGTVIRKYYTSDTEAEPVFYKISEKMKPGYLRYFIRFFEYIFSYLYIYKMICKNNYDIVHIQWPQILWFDKFIFKKIKRKCKKLVYTAHDPIPHESTVNKIKSFGKLYQIPDKIIVHGKACVEQFEKYYPNIINKVYNQKFGVTPPKEYKLNYNLLNKHKKLKQIYNSDKIVFAFLGQISPYKGLDVLLEAWEEIKNRDDAFLIISGKTINGYKELKDVLCKAFEYKNVYIYNERYDSEEEVLFHTLSDVVVLPYRTASMSGVLTSAAQYQKTILTTEVGSIKEYIEPVREYVFTCDCTKESISKQLLNILSNYSKESLAVKGYNFSRIIQEEYNWDTIYKEVIKNCYL